MVQVFFVSVFVLYCDEHEEFYFKSNWWCYEDVSSKCESSIRLTHWVLIRKAFLTALDAKILVENKREQEAFDIKNVIFFKLFAVRAFHEKSDLYSIIISNNWFISFHRHDVLYHLCSMFTHLLLWHVRHFFSTSSNYH